MGYCVSKGYGVQFCAQKFGAQAKLHMGYKGFDCTFPLETFIEMHRPL